jgi:cytochrome c oxidase assembly protein subunit 15
LGWIHQSLIGSIGWIACIITFILSFGYRRKQKTNFNLLLICVLMVFKLGWEKRLLTLFLNPFNKSTHMLAALLIVFDCYLYQKNIKHLFSIKSLIDISWFIRSNHHSNRFRNHGSWARGHRLWDWCSWNYVASKSYYSILYPSLFSNKTINLYLFYLNRKLTLGFNKINWVIAILFVEIISEFQCIILHSHSNSNHPCGVSHTLIWCSIFTWF